MTDHRQADLYKTQQSLTEWLQDINHVDTAAIRLEDNEKRERLRTLKQIIGMPFDEPTQFEGTDLRDKTPSLITYLEQHGDELCALRLIPKEGDLPKLRMRGKTVADAYAWFEEQGIDAEKYRADYMPHTEKSTWSTIFVVNKHGIQGEIIRGGHYQLTQGFFDSGKPIIFSFDFNEWHLSEDDDEAKQELLEIAEHLRVGDVEMQARLQKELDAEFINDYLTGYFETVKTDDFGLWFVDYSRILGKMFEDAQFKPITHNSVNTLSGQVGCPGVVEGLVHIVALNEIENDFPANAVLVCPVTTPEYVPLMQRAAAIVTDQGGILSHAAIVARELRKPCIVGTGNATKALKNGQRIRVDANQGTVTVIPADPSQTK